MIYDDITNIERYNIPENVVSFIKAMSDDITEGKYKVDENNYANVNVYTTKSHQDCPLEAHKKYIDIQLLLYGKEQLNYTDINGLSVSNEYDESRDVMFFHTPAYPLNSIQLSKGKFTLLYPNEAHSPQMNYNDNSCEVKKVVVKIKVD